MLIRTLMCKQPRSGRLPNWRQRRRGTPAPVEPPNPSTGGSTRCCTRRHHSRRYRCSRRPRYLVALPLRRRGCPPVELRVPTQWPRCAPS